jgi:hypothetical protein
MTNPTSNFGWQMPTPTDLVTDLPADFEVFGQAVDTSLADLQGGTTGQILAKASNTDMDFAWITNDVGDITAVNVTSPITGGGSSGAVTLGVSAASTAAAGVVQLSDSTSTTSSVLASTPTATKSAYDLADTANTTATAAIPKSTVTTAGDVIYATGSAAVTRLGIGTAGQVLQVNSGATAPEWATPASASNLFYAGKNKIINGKFDVWQRGTSFGSPASGTYTADRFKFSADGSGATRTLSQQTFTPGTAPVAGYESQFFFRFDQSVAGTGGSFNVLQQLIEDVRTFAGQTVTISFWAKAAASTSITTGFDRNYGSGGSSSDFGISTATHTLTTSWVRYTNTVSLASLTGKTIGAGSYLTTSFGMPNNATFTVDIWGVQVEAGSTATDFQTATGSIAGELALCQRYCYVVQGNTTNASSLGTGYWNGTTNVVGFLSSKSQMRTTPTLIFSQASDFEALQVGVSWNAVSAVVIAAEANAHTAQFSVTTTGGTSAQAANIRLKNLSTAYIGLVAEL